MRVLLKKKGKGNTVFMKSQPTGMLLAKNKLEEHIQGHPVRVCCHFCSIQYFL